MWGPSLYLRGVPGGFTSPGLGGPGVPPRKENRPFRPSVPTGLGGGIRDAPCRVGVELDLDDVKWRIHATSGGRRYIDANYVPHYSYPALTLVGLWRRWPNLNFRRPPPKKMSLPFRDERTVVFIRPCGRGHPLTYVRPDVSRPDRRLSSSLQGRIGLYRQAVLTTLCNSDPRSEHLFLCIKFKVYNKLGI